jgi:hypothetical protein
MAGMGSLARTDVYDIPEFAAGDRPLDFQERWQGEDYTPYPAWAQQAYDMPRTPEAQVGMFPAYRPPVDTSNYPDVGPPAVNLGRSDLGHDLRGDAALGAIAASALLPNTRLGMALPMTLDADEARADPFSKLRKAGKMGDVLSPNIISRANPDPGDIHKVMEVARAYGRKGWPTAEREVFKTTPEAYAETTSLVPQISIKDRLPGPLPGEALPNKGRADIIVQNTDAIANRIAERLDPMVRAGDERLKFYHTGPVIRGLERYGEMPVGDANLFMRNWAGQGAATSPRTQTPPNLRNSSYLTYLRESGNPLTPERYAAEGNTPGFPMMGMHVDLADKFARGAENALTNPKPTTFRENWSGNLRDVTGDTHNIRSTLYEMDQLHPGSLPRGWFTSDKAYAKYRSDGFQAVDPGDIADTLGDKTVKGIRRQSEYLPMTEPWYRAAQKLGIAPAEGQSGGWFSYGGITGLQSPPKTIPNLLNDQVDATAKALNVPPEKVVQWWSRGQIPLAGIGGAAMMGELARTNRYQPEE